MYIAIYMFSISVYPSGYYNNVTRDPKISGNFYGSCTCPDGKKYYAGDNNNLCSTLACYGGTSGNCKKTNSPSSVSNSVVYCNVSMSYEPNNYDFMYTEPESDTLSPGDIAAISIGAVMVFLVVALLAFIKWPSGQRICVRRDLAEVVTTPSPGLDTPTISTHKPNIVRFVE